MTFELENVSSRELAKLAELVSGDIIITARSAVGPRNLYTYRMIREVASPKDLGELDA
jgi:hypothetical protein